MGDVFSETEQWEGDPEGLGGTAFSTGGGDEVVMPERHHGQYWEDSE